MHLRHEPYISRNLTGGIEPRVEALAIRNDILIRYARITVFSTDDAVVRRVESERHDIAYFRADAIWLYALSDAFAKSMQLRGQYLIIVTAFRDIHVVYRPVAVAFRWCGAVVRSIFTTILRKRYTGRERRGCQESD